MIFIWKSLKWMTSCAVTLLVLMVYLFFHYDFHLPISIEQSQQKTQVVSSQNQGENQVMRVESSMNSQDGRAQIVANFLEKYGSPLQPYDHYGEALVEIADRYQIDFRFIPAIMMEESQLCKRIPEGSYNCLGFGIHSGKVLKFENYEANFERAARELRANYVEKGRIQVSEIARKYTASVDKWTNSVNQWMTEMEYDDRKMGIEKKTDGNVLEYARVEMEEQDY